MNVVNTQILLNGPRHIIFAVYLKSDGASGELSNYTLFSLADAGLKLPDRFRLQMIDYNFAGFDAVVEFASGGVNPNWKWVLAEGSNYGMNFEPYGNIIDDGGMDRTGEFQISTTGFTSSQDQGSMLIQLRKPRDA